MVISLLMISLLYFSRLNSRSPRSKGSHSLDESAKNISKTGKIRKSSANLPIPPFHERAASTPTQIDHLQVKENISSSHKKFPNSVEKLYHDSNASISTPKKLSDPEKSFKSAYNSEISTGKQCKRSASGFLDRSRLGKRNDKFADDTLLRKRSSEIVETPHGPVSSADLLAELLKGSSEKQVTEHAHATSRGATSVLPKAVLRCLVSGKSNWFVCSPYLSCARVNFRWYSSMYFQSLICIIDALIWNICDKQL